jgi:uncharacterized YccA/Bax inhibitor family protein
MMRSGNPALKADTFRVSVPGTSAEAMTVAGTVNKTLVLLGLTGAGAYYSWFNPQVAFQWFWLFLIGAFVIGLVVIFKKTTAPVLAPVYAGLEGLLLGAISVMFERTYPGIVTQAVFLTFGVLFALLMAYKSGLIRATENFKLGVAAPTGGIALYYLISLVVRLASGKSLPLIHDATPMGILFSLFVVVIASLNLVMDFDFIEQGAERGAPKFMEWYGAFGLLVTLIWLYLEILRLLAKTRRR